MGAKNRGLAAHYLPGLKNLNQGLVGHWTLDDRSGTQVTENVAARHGVYVEDIATKNHSATGIHGYAMNIKSSTDKFYADVANALPAFKDLTKGSVMGWVRLPKGATGTYNMLSASSSRSWCEKFNLNVRDGLAQLEFDCPGRTPLIRGSKLINDGNWHHIAATVKDKQTILYVDGIQDVANTNSTFFSKPNINRAYIGVQLDGNNGRVQGKYWQGDIDDVRIFNRVLPATDIQAFAKYITPASNKYRLTIEGGSGSGEYAAGQKVNIVAANPDSQIFIRWQGNVELLNNPSLASAQIVMPAANMELVALSTLAGDSDGDGVSDYQEALVGSDPYVKDTDGDGLSDKQEIDAGLDPSNSDTDGDGINDKQELDNKTNPQVDDQPPVIHINSMAIAATGDLTPYTFEGVYALDGKDGAVAVSIENPGPYKSGRHIIRFKAKDKQGNETSLERTLDVYPMAKIDRIPVIIGGNQRIKVHVSLSGDAPQYPASIGIEVAPSSTFPQAEYRFVDSNITITSGRTGYTEIELLNIASPHLPKTMNLRLAVTGKYVVPLEDQIPVRLTVHQDELANGGIIKSCDIPLTADEKRGLMLHWTLDEASGTAVIDASGKGNGGTYSEAAAKSNSTGVFGYAYQGNGARSIAGNAGSVAAIKSLHTNKIGSILLWVKLDPQVSGKQRLLSTSRTESERDKFELLTYGDGTFGMDDGRPNSGGPDYRSDTRITDNEWHLVGLTMSDEGSQFIIDGKVTNKYNNNLNEFLRYANILTLGSTVAPKGALLTAQVDDFRIYNRVLSDNELELLYLRYMTVKNTSLLVNKAIGRIQTGSGVQIVPGTISQHLLRSNALLDAALLKTSFFDATGDSLNSDTLDTHSPLDGYYNFTASNLDNYNVLFVVPLQTPLAENTQLLLLNNEQKWLSFTADGNQIIKSAPMVEGQCPSPGSRLYTAELTAGNKCVEVVLEDNGSYDRDSADGRIEVLAVLSAKDKRYQLRVINGTGSGVYSVNEVITVKGITSNAEQEFISWTGDIAKLDNAKLEEAILTMPDRDVMIIAGYNKDAVVTLPTTPSPGGSSGGSMSWHVLVLLLMLTMRHRAYSSITALKH